MNDIEEPNQIPPQPSPDDQITQIDAEIDNLTDKLLLYDELKNFDIKIDMLSNNTNIIITDDLNLKIKRLKILIKLLLNNFTVYDDIKYRLLVLKIKAEYSEIVDGLKRILNAKSN